MTGINSVIFYSSNIFAFAGIEQPIVGTITIGVINVAATVLSSQLIGGQHQITFISCVSLLAM
jgi:hypothetical protein